MLGFGRRRRETGGAARSAPQIDADLSGAVISGQVAIGEHIVQIHAEHGAIVNYRPPVERPVPRARDTPVRRLPRAFDALVGRGELLSEMHSALAGGGPAELVGEPGIGKTSLLRNVSHHLAELQPHGVIYTVARGLPPDDVLQFLFESFYDRGGEAVVATLEELSRLLGDRQALIVIDDLALTREELEWVMDLVPSSIFVWASPDRRLWGAGRSFDVAGLDDAAALALLERELGRALAPEMSPGLLQWCRALGSSPLRILQVGALVRSGVITAGAISAGAITTGQGELARAALDQLLAGQLSEADRRVISPLTAVAKVPVPTEAIAAASGVNGAAELLAGLEDQHVVESHSPRYTLAGDPGPALTSSPGPEDAAVLAERARAALVEFFAGRGGDLNADPQRLADAELVLALIREAQRRESLEDVLALAHAGDRALALGAHWGAWRIALEAALDAAIARGATADEAWARHQLGSRALGLGDQATAAQQLSLALQLRESLGDEAGASITRHNLDLLSGPPPPGHPPPQPRPRLPLIAGAMTVAAIVGVAVAVAASGGGHASGPVASSSSAGTPPLSTSASDSVSSSSSSSSTNGGSTSTTPPPLPLTVVPNPIKVRVVQRAQVVLGRQPATVTNTSSSSVSVQQPQPDEQGYHASMESCFASLAPGASCGFTVSVEATTPPAPAASLTFQLNGGPAVTVPVALCNAQTTTGPSRAATNTDTTPATETTTTTTGSLYPPC